MSFKLKAKRISDVKRKPAKYLVFDFETVKWTKFLVAGIYDGRKFTYYVSLRSFIKALFQEYEGYQCFAHFGGRFDFLFCLKTLWENEEYRIEPIIPRGAGILCFDAVWQTKRGQDLSRITFRDSSALFPFSLKRLTESFGVSHVKQEIDYNKIKKITPKLLEYLEYDCRGLYESIEKFYSWPLIEQAGAAFTLAGQAMKVLQVYLKQDIYPLRRKTDEKIRRSYFGGRTEIFKPYYDSKYSESALWGLRPLYCYDVNSLYPTVMLENEYPNAFEYETYHWEPDAKGFYECNVEVPRDMYLPPLGTMGVTKSGKPKFIFPTGTFSGTYSIPEILYARSLGVKIETKRGYIFSNAGKLFEGFVEGLYAIKKGAPKDSVDATIAKLLLNSCYGRFGLHWKKENVVLDDGSKGIKPLRELTVLGRKLVLGTKEVEVNSFSNVAIASYVTAYSRIKMHKIMKRIETTLYYTDTDSIFTTTPFWTGEELGELKLEYACNSAVFLLPKTYIAGEKIAMKGFDKKKIQHFSYEDFFACLEGDLKRLSIVQEPRFATLKTALKQNKFVTMTPGIKHFGPAFKSNRQIKSTYDKRILNIRENNSIPLHLEKGKAI